MSCRKATALIFALSFCAVMALRVDGIRKRPMRPDKNASIAEIIEYAKKLQSYYSIDGRGRFGKRGYDLPEFYFRRTVDFPSRDLYDSVERLAQYD